MKVIALRDWDEKFGIEFKEGDIIELETVRKDSRGNEMDSNAKYVPGEYRELMLFFNERSANSDIFTRQYGSGKKGFMDYWLKKI
jgi:hypothetical protein